MELTAASIDDLVDALAARLKTDRASTGRDSLLPAAAVWERVGVIADAARAWVAAEIASESRFELGAESLAVQNGFSSGKKLLARGHRMLAPHRRHPDFFGFPGPSADLADRPGGTE